MKLKIVCLILRLVCIGIIFAEISTVATICGIICFVIAGLVSILVPYEPIKKDGEIHIIDTDEKTIWQFELTNDAEKIRGQKTVTFGVKDSSS